MELNTVDLPKSHRIIEVGDLHRGSSAFHSKGWTSVIQRLLKERDLYVILMGDLLEAILIDDKRFQIEIHGIQSLFMNHLTWLRRELEVVRKKIIGIHFGNHEAKLFKLGDFTRMLAEDLGVPYAGYSAKTTVRDARSGLPLYKLYTTHGKLTLSSTADDPVRRKSNMKLMLKRKLHPLAGDCVVMSCGHAHKLITVKPERELYMTDREGTLHAHYTQAVQHGEYIDPNLRFYCCSGSFLKSAVVGATTYAEMAMYAPVQLGYPEIIVRDGVVVDIKEVHLGADAPVLEPLTFTTPAPMEGSDE